MTITFEATETEKQAQIKARQHCAYEAVQQALGTHDENVLWNLLSERAGSPFETVSDLNGNEIESYNQWSPMGMLLNTRVFAAWSAESYLQRLLKMKDKTPAIKGIITPKRQEALDKRAQRIVNAETSRDHAVAGAVYAMDNSMERANDSIGEILDDFIENQRNTAATKTIKLEFTSLVNAGVEKDLAEMIAEHDLPAGFVDNLNTILSMGYTKTEIRNAIETRVKADKTRALEMMNLAYEQGEDFINLFFEIEPHEGFTFTEKENESMVASAERAANMYRKKVLSDLNMSTLPVWHESNRANWLIATSMVDAVAAYEHERTRIHTEEDSQGPASKDTMMTSDSSNTEDRTRAEMQQPE